jgi:hypothetical protein
MPAVNYAYEFPYFYSTQGDLFPILQVDLVNPRTPTRMVEVNAFLDSGAQHSLFDGGLARFIGIDVFSGQRVRLAAVTGARVDGFLHPVRLSHPDLGPFDLDVGFSTVQLRRNLLGRDFFNLVQIGFRERHSLFYVTPQP